MGAVLPYYKDGPMNKQVSTLVYGGQLVQPTTNTTGTTDFTVKPATAGSIIILGVAGADANILTAQTGSPNTYGQPQIDISVLTDYVAVYYTVDIWVWYSGAVPEGQKLISGANGTVVTAGVSPAADVTAGICTQPGGISAAMLTQQIGGQGAATFFLGRARMF
jgi:hypothetical protein